MSTRPFPKLRPGIWDALVAAVVIVLAVVCAGAFWVRGTLAEGELTAVVSMDGQERERFALSDGEMERTYTNHGYTLHLLVQSGELRVAEADCPTQDCVHTGTIDQAGQSIVCLPARIVVQLVRTGGNGDVDVVIG